MNKETVHALIREIIQNANTRLTPHCRDKMKARNVCMDDFLNVIMWGDLKEFVVKSEDHEIKCKIAGKDLDGEDLTLIVAVLERDYAVLCITVHD